MSLCVSSGLYALFSSSPSFVRNGPGTEPALARLPVRPAAGRCPGWALFALLLLTLCCALALPPMAQAGEKQAKVKPRVKYYQVEDTGWNVCRDMVKNLNKLQPSRVSFWCKLRFHPDMPQFSEPDWEELKIENNLQMIYDLEQGWNRTSDQRPSFAEWQAQYIHDMRAGYRELRGIYGGRPWHCRSPFRPCLRRAKVRFEQNGPLVTVVSYTYRSLAEQESFCETLYTTCSYDFLHMDREPYRRDYANCVAAVEKKFGFVDGLWAPLGMPYGNPTGLVEDSLYVHVPVNEFNPHESYEAIPNDENSRRFPSQCDGRQLFLYKGRAFSISKNRTICRMNDHMFKDICAITGEEVLQP